MHVGRTNIDRFTISSVDDRSTVPASPVEVSRRRGLGSFSAHLPLLNFSTQADGDAESGRAEEAGRRIACARQGVITRSPSKATFAMTAR